MSFRSVVIFSILAVRTQEAILAGHSQEAIGDVKFDLSFLLVI